MFDFPATQSQVQESNRTYQQDQIHFDREQVAEAVKEAVKETDMFKGAELFKGGHNVTPCKFKPLNSSTSSVRNELFPDGPPSPVFARVSVPAPAPAAPAPAEVTPVDDPAPVPADEVAPVVDPARVAVPFSVPVSLPVPASDGAIASASGYDFDAATNPALFRLMRSTENLDDAKLANNFAERKNKNIQKETSKTALKQRQLDEESRDRQLRAAAHADLNTYHRHVQDSDRFQLQSFQEFNKIYERAEAVKADIEKKKLELLEKKMMMEEQQHKQKLEAADSDRELRERELTERKANRLTYSRWMATGKCVTEVTETQLPPRPPPHEDLLELSQIDADNDEDDDKNVLDSTQNPKKQ